MEFHGISIPRWEVPWNSMKLRKFHGTWSDTKFHGIPWNSRAAKWAITKFHRIPWNSMELWCCQIKSQLSSIEFHGTWDYCFNHYQVPLDFHVIFHGIHGTLQSSNRNSPSSTELGKRHLKWHRCSMEFHGIFHGIPWNSDAAKWNIT